MRRGLSELLLLLFVATTNALTFKVATMKSECMYAGLEKGDYMTASMFIKSGPNLNVSYFTCVQRTSGQIIHIL